MRRLGVVPDDVAATPTDLDEEREPITSNDFITRQKAAQGASLFRSFSAFIGGNDYDYSLEEEKARLPEPTEREKALLEKSETCARACKFSNLFADSKFLGKESLAHLVAALAWAAGDPAQPPQSADDEDAALFCLDAMLSVCYRNKDRWRLCLPRVVSHIKKQSSALLRKNRRLWWKEQSLNFCEWCVEFFQSKVACTVTRM